ncbi:Cytochrome c oxidase subunit 13, mitochondrial [Schizosaccharomyces pombe]
MMNRNIGFLSRTLKTSVPKRAGLPSFRAYSNEAKVNWLEEVQAEEEHAKRSSEFWKKVTYYIGGPALILASANAYYIYCKHQEHAKHVEDTDPGYSFENLRFKKYPWGDGSKTLFWNDKVNHLKKDDE